MLTAATWLLQLGAVHWAVGDGATSAARAAPPRPQRGRQQTKLLTRFLKGPMSGVEEIVFCCRQMGKDGHWYANFGYYAPGPSQKAYAAMGRLCKLNLRTGKVTTLLDDPAGTVRDPQVHYDGGKILFSYRKGSSERFHLYEIDTAGGGLRQLTRGTYDDIEPTYLPDGDILFVSSRCRRWVSCWLTHVATLHRCDADGRNVREISANIEHDNTPWLLPDGRVLFQRWEYVDRSQVHFHHLWAANPDGTGEMVYFGNMHPGTVMIDAKPIPRPAGSRRAGTGKVVAIFSPGHGRREHDGVVTVVSPDLGPDHQPSARPVNRRAIFRDPYPFSEDCFLVASRATLVVMDGQGRTEVIYALPDELRRQGVQCHEPRPVVPRPRERIIAPRVDRSSPTGRLILADVYRGRNMAGVRPGEIKKLLVLEPLPKPVNYDGGTEPLTMGGTFNLERTLGTVDVEADGSAYFELPANRSVFFVAMDARGNSVKRMHSFVSVKPGETTGCVGCHEHRHEAPANRSAGLTALSRPPGRIRPVEGVPEVFDFPRDIQPILDRHCVTCHNVEKRKGGILLTGDRGPLYSHAYYTLTVWRQFADGRNRPQGNYPPRAVGAPASPLMKKISGAHHDVRVSPRERKRVRYWIESGAVYPGTYAALGGGMVGGYVHNHVDPSDRQWPESVAAAKVIQQRCARCHSGARTLPKYLSGNRGSRHWGLHSGQPQSRYCRHIAFNLTRPAKSLILLAPLSKQAGGYGICAARARAGKRPAGADTEVFADTRDAGYRALLALCRAGKRRLDEITRFDMPDFRPPAPYVREMKRYGVLPADLPADARIDVYRTDRAYWRALWYRPTASPAGGKR